ncbi:Ada metal-binding domain-containing protein [Lactiplantibacillus brownii]
MNQPKVAYLSNSGDKPCHKIIFYWGIYMMHHFKRYTLGLVLLATTGLALAGCSAGTSTTDSEAASSKSSSVVSKSSSSASTSATSDTASSSSQAESSSSSQSETAHTASSQVTTSSSAASHSTSQTESSAKAAAPETSQPAPAPAKPAAEKNDAIWGNATTKIYHVPGQHSYRVHSGNVVHFDSEAAAVAAGYRRSKK